MLKIGLGQGALACSAICAFCAVVGACGGGGNHPELFEYSGAAGGGLESETGVGRIER